MPTYERTPLFLRDWQHLSQAEKDEFLAMVRQFVFALKQGPPLPNGLHVKDFRSVSGWFEIRWSGDGRALFSYGSEVREGEVHIIWHRVGSHNIYKAR
jgi:hypothetical protein